jgi:hypothetical protein
MAKLTQFDRASVRQILNDCDSALQAVAKKYGLTLIRKNCNYYPNEVPVAFKLIVTQVNEDGEGIDPSASDFLTHAEAFGLSKDDLGKTFTVRGDSFKVCGLAPKSHKYPILAQKIGTTKRFKFGVYEVRSFLEREK